MEVGNGLLLEIESLDGEDEDEVNWNSQGSEGE
jgi:hypothetical protein